MTKEASNQGGAKRQVATRRLYGIGVALITGLAIIAPAPAAHA